MPADPVRDAAIDVLLRVFEKDAYLSDSLDRTLRRRKVSGRGRRFMTQLVYGTVRHKLLADFLLEGLVHQPLEDLPAPIHAILRMGVFQALFCDQVTFPAMVHTSVDLAKKRGHAGTARLVNAVLKRVPKSLEVAELPDALTPRALSIRHSMPRWIVERWIDELGEETARDICEACNQPAATTLRANTLQATAERVVDRLLKAGAVAEKRTPVPEEVTLLEGPPPARSKLFGQGLFLIQDPASMLPSHLLEPKGGEWILDMCAAPGGKTTHIAQLSEGEARVVGADVNPWRCASIAENVERLGVPGVSPICADGLRPPFDGCFDRVLVDAPCSGLGTLRRHPDLKWRAQPGQVDALAEIQRGLLRSAVGLCKNHGVIVYSVCTFTEEETMGVVDEILASEPVELEDGPAWMNQWKTRQGTYRTLPHEDQLDGFFLTRLRKRC